MGLDPGDVGIAVAGGGLLGVALGNGLVGRVHVTVDAIGCVVAKSTGTVGAGDLVTGFGEADEVGATVGRIGDAGEAGAVVCGLAGRSACPDSGPGRHMVNASAASAPTAAIPAVTRATPTRLRSQSHAIGARVIAPCAPPLMSRSFGLAGRSGADSAPGP